tara:strand:- start:331 stop:507 length:177 start_codon:yes stop_codon:yes gene_type:complete
LDFAKGAAHGLNGGQARGLTAATFSDAVGSGVAQLVEGLCLVLRSLIGLHRAGAADHS